MEKVTTWGYLRISTTKQDIENNKINILKFANEKELGYVKFIEEIITGRKDWKKRKLGEYFKYHIKDGDILIMSELSRISRNMLDSFEFLASCKRRNIKIYSTIGDIPDNCDAMATLITALNAWKSQQERELISTRTRLKLQNLKAGGKILGRKVGSMILEGKNETERINNINDIKNMICEGVKYKNICLKYDTTRATLRKFIKKYDLKN